MGTVIGGFLDGRQDDWKNRISGSGKGQRLSESLGKRFVHVGVHRTGATYLQRVVFPSYSECEALFSDDVIAGKLFDNGLDNVARVHEMVGGATIIIVLRNQASLINSAYRTYVKAGGTWNYGRYADEIIIRGKYDFANLVSRYFAVFGRDNIQVLFYEDMMADPQAFLIELMSIVGVSEVRPHANEAANPGPTKYYNAGVRWLNILFRPFYSMSWARQLRARLLRLGIGLDTHIVKKLIREPGAKQQWGYTSATVRIHAAYSECNERLGEMLNRDIRALGYC